MSQVTYDVYRGSQDGKPVLDSLTRTIQPTEVFVKITHSGICGTDMFCLEKEVVIGHEGIGIVQQIGSQVTSFQVGDRVGFGGVKKCCGNCENCLTGRDQYCPKVELYGWHAFDTGSFSTGTICDQTSLVHIPDGIDSADAAPLMCAGATVWEVLSKPCISHGDRVGVMGIGGLGHLAVKIGAQMGYHIVVLSSSESKREEAMQFGAKEFHVLRSDEPAPDGIAPLNHLLLCTSGKANYDQLISLMATNGTLYPLTVDLTPSSINIFGLILKSACIQGSMSTSRIGMRDMLSFCDKHKVRAQIQKYPLTAEGIIAAMQDLRDGKVRYRAVLVGQ